MVPGLNNKLEGEKNRLMNKMLEGGYANLDDKDKALWDKIKKLDPELAAEEAEKQAEKAKEKRDTLKDKVNDLYISVDLI